MKFMAGVIGRLETDGGLIPLINGRVFIHPGPQDAMSPYLTCQVTSSVPTRTFDGPTYDDCGFQVDCWVLEDVAGASKYKTLTTIADLVRTNLDDSGGILNTQEVSLIQYDGERDLADDKWLRRQMDFTAKVKRG